MHKIIEKVVGLQFLEHDMKTWALEPDGTLSGVPFKTYKGRVFGRLPGWSYVQKCNKCGYVRNNWVDKVITFFAPRRKPPKYLRGNTF